MFFKLSQQKGCAVTNYVFDANPNYNEVDWNNPSSWYGGIVPDSADAQVIIPTVTFTNGGDYETIINIGSGESYAVQSVTIANNSLNLFGNLSISGALDLESGNGIELFGGHAELRLAERRQHLYRRQRPDRGHGHAR